MSYIKDEVKDTKEFQINQWTAAKKQKVKELTFVQHKLTGFFLTSRQINRRMNNEKQNT